MTTDRQAVKVLQERFIALGFQLPHFGADGDFGSESISAAHKALDELAVRRGLGGASVLPEPPSLIVPEAVQPAAAGAAPGIVPADWMPDAKISRIIIHWTAGQNTASALDKAHYHLLIEGDGKLVRGTPTIDLNSEPKTKTGYAAHTLNSNTGSIGVSLCGMALAVENPFNPGKQPITEKQWKVLADVLADLCRRYRIKVDRKTLLSHAEVQQTLGIKQKGKWDISVLPFDPSIKGALAVGDNIRSHVQAKL